MFNEGSKVRYVGTIESMKGEIGLFTWLRNTDLYCGCDLGPTPGFARENGWAEFVLIEDLELVA